MHRDTLGPVGPTALPMRSTTSRPWQLRPRAATATLLRCPPAWTPTIPTPRPQQQLTRWCVSQIDSPVPTLALSFLPSLAVCGRGARVSRRGRPLAETRQGLAALVVIGFAVHDSGEIAATQMPPRHRVCGLTLPVPNCTIPTSPAVLLQLRNGAPAAQCDGGGQPHGKRGAH